MSRQIKYWRKEFSSCILEYVYENCTDKQIEVVTKNRLDIPIDLIYFEHKNSVFMYEIKASGGLDTKNRSGNANEVIRNKNLFSFVGNVYSLFGVCYNNCGEDNGKVKWGRGVKYRGNFPIGPMFRIVGNEPDMEGKIVVGSVFWEEILPPGIGYQRFIEIYTEAFQNSGIEEMINNL